MPASIDIAYWANWAQLIGFPLAFAAVIYAAWQLRTSARIARGQFLLELTKMSERHDYVLHRVTPGGEWAEGMSRPQSPEDWSKLVDYIGLFENCEALIRDGSLDERMFKRLFAYRMKNLARLEFVMDMINQPDEDWELFKSAMARAGIDPRKITPALAPTVAAVAH
jgi:hypothetical protein